MLSIALVEDTAQDAQMTAGAIEQYMNDVTAQWNMVQFTNAHDFLEASRSRALDIVFLDIEMPGISGDGMDGMTAAAHYREISAAHTQTAIIFTTKVAQLAAQGYEVSAIGYLIKPFDYATFSMTMKRAISHAKARTKTVDITVNSSDGTHFLSSQDIISIEVRDHMVYIHLSQGRTLATWGSLKEFTAQLGSVDFAQCNRYTLVNLRYVSGFTDRELILSSQSGDSTRIEMSRGKKASVLDALLTVKANQ